MGREIKFLLGFILMNAWACQAFCQVKGISNVGGKYIIDTNIILANENLPPLMDSLIKSNLDEKTNIKEIPGFVMKFLKKLTGRFTIANPGKDWQATDNVINTRLPDRQLIYFGLGKNIALLAYYTGGFGVSEHILIIKFTDTKVTDFWCGNILEDVTNKNEIINLLQKNKDNYGVLNAGNLISL